MSPGHLAFEVAQVTKGYYFIVDLITYQPIAQPTRPR